MRWEMLASGYGLVEGPTVAPDGGLYFSDVLGGGVHHWTPDGEVRTVVPKRKGVGGIACHADGGLVVSGRDVQHVHDGAIDVLFAIAGLPGFNDLCTDALGRIYVGAVRFMVFEPGAEHRPGELWRIDPDGTATELFGDVQHCNGVAVAGDGRTLYHSDTRGERLIVHDLDPDTGDVSNRRHWATGPRSHPDGMAVDETGAVWVADASGGRVLRFRPDGSLDGQLDVPARMVTSVCFAGTDLVVVTADNTIDPERRGCVLRTSVGVAGVPIHPARCTHGN